MNLVPVLNAPCLGVCYYPEHWPRERWAEDARAMVTMGVQLVRLGEFAWSEIEPSPGVWNWGWYDEAIATLAGAGLKLVLCTPTATPPKWLIDAWPQVLARDVQGQPRRFGSRRHYDFSSADYRREALRITAAVVARYGEHPAVVAWQTDNEYGCHDTVQSFSPEAVQAFRDWLLERHGRIEALNAAWGTVFWGQTYRSFDEIDAPAGTVTEAHPAHRLDWRRCASDQVVSFNRAQVQQIRAGSPGRRVLHNTMLFFTEFDHHRLARDLDLVGWDSYPLGALENFWFDDDTKARWLQTGHPDFAGFHHDLYRAMSRQPFWVMEQQPGAVNWGRWNPAPAPGMVRLWTWEALAHGADVVSYFRWRQLPFGQEQCHGGLHRPDGTRDRGGDEAAEVAREIERLKQGGHDFAPPDPAPVALVLDYESLWSIEIQPQGASEHGLRQIFEAYSALRRQGLDVDVVGPDHDLDGARLIVLPAQAIVPGPLLQALQRARDRDAHIVLYPRSGSRTDSMQTAAPLPPGALRALIDVQVLGVESLRPGVQRAVHLPWGAGRLVQWQERLQIGQAVEVLATDATGQAVWVRQGAVSYLGGLLQAEDLQQCLAHCARAAGVSAPFGAAARSSGSLPEGLRLRRRGSLLFVLNYDPQPHRLDMPGIRWLLGGPEVPPRGLCIGALPPASSPEPPQLLP